MVSIAVPVLSVLAALGLWELISQTEVISQRDLPAMSTTVQALWDMVQTGTFWKALGETVRGWAIGLGLAAALAVPIGIALGSSDFAASAFRVPIEFLRPIPSAALIPLLFLTLGTTLKSEVFLATFGAFWPLLVQTMYGVRDVDPVAMDTARSFQLGPVRAAVPGHAAERPAVHHDRRPDLVDGRADPGLHRRALHGHARPRPAAQLRSRRSGSTTRSTRSRSRPASSGVAIHFAVSAVERRVLHWHPSQRKVDDVSPRVYRTLKIGAEIAVPFLMLLAW